MRLPPTLVQHSVWSKCTGLERAVLLTILWWSLQIILCGAVRLGRPALSTTPTTGRRAVCHVTGAQQVSCEHPQV